MSMLAAWLTLICSGRQSSIEMSRVHVFAKTTQSEEFHETNEFQEFNDAGIASHVNHCLQLLNSAGIASWG